MNHVDHVTLKRYPVLNSMGHLYLDSLNLSRKNVLSVSISEYTLIASRFGKNEKVAHSTSVSPIHLCICAINFILKDCPFYVKWKTVARDVIRNLP